MAEKRAKRPRIKITKMVNPKTGKVRIIKRIDDSRVAEPMEKYWREMRVEFGIEEAKPKPIEWPEKFRQMCKDAKFAPILTASKDR